MNDQNKTQTYLIGVLVGGLLGLTASFFYTRSVEEDELKGGKAERRIQTLDLIGLLLAVAGLLRQVSELGRSPDAGKKR